MSPLQQPVCEPGVLESVLLVNPFEENQRDLQAILLGWPAPVESLGTLEEAWSCLRHGPAPLILCERDLPDGNWKVLFELTETLPRPPRFIVSSRLADDYLWVEVLNLGGQDVLQTPFVAHEVRHAVQSAWNVWQRLWVPKANRRSPGDAAASAGAKCRDGAAASWLQPVAAELPDAAQPPIGRITPSRQLES